MPRIIAHIDMDAFFAAIEERDNPRLKGRPIVVGADPKDGKGRGVVATANYAARKYGIRSALPISTAWRLAEEARKRGEPPTAFLGGNMRKYGQVSREIMGILQRYVPQIEQASVDEAFADLSFTGSYAKAASLARKIKKEIKNKERLTASMGIGPNKLVAKIASDRQKPDGLTVVTVKQVESFLEPLLIRTIPGIGPKTEEQLKKLNISTIKDLKRLSLEELKEMMGKWGNGLYERARGRDDSPLILEWEAKSIGEQETLEEDSLEPNLLQPLLAGLADGVHAQFQRDGFNNFRTITITVRFADFTTKTRSSTLKAPGDKLEVLRFEALRLFMPFLDARENPERKKIRLLGVRVEKLS